MQLLNQRQFTHSLVVSLKCLIHHFGKCGVRCRVLLAGELALGNHDAGV